jgi:hypothetical protein
VGKTKALSDISKTQIFIALNFLILQKRLKEKPTSSFLTILEAAIIHDVNGKSNG